MSHRTRSATALQERYTRLPDALIAALSPREHQLVHALLSYRWTDAAAIYPRIGVLAERLDWSARTVQRTLRSLEAGGWIVSVARYRDDGGRTSNEYRPGPMLAPLLAPRRPEAVTGPRQPWPRERDSGNHQTPTRGRQAGYPQPPSDARAYLAGRYGRLVRT
jgi:hypothetical protein